MSERGPGEYKQRVEMVVKRTQDAEISAYGDSLAVTIDKSHLLVSSTPEEREAANRYATTIVEAFGHNFHTVQDMVETSRDEHRKVNQEIAGVCLRKIADELIRFGLIDQDWARVVTLSPSEIDKGVPDAFKGIGEVVIDILYESKGINRMVKSLDKTRSGMNRNSPSSIKRLLDLEAQVISKITIGEGVDSAHNDEVDLFLAYATEEAEILEERIKELEAEQIAQSGERNRLPRGVRYVPPRPAEGEEGGNGRGEYSLYGPSEEILTGAIMEGSESQFDWKRPPTWYERLNPKEKALIRVMSHLVDISSKKAFLDSRLDDLIKRRHTDLSILEVEFATIYKEPIFRQAIKKILNELFEFVDEGGTEYLHLKRKPGSVTRENPTGEIDPDVKSAFMNMEMYLETLAFRIEHPELSVEECKTRVDNGERARNFRTRMIVGSAWNFLYDFDTVESADVDRELYPLRTRSERVASYMHPRSKLRAKIIDEDGENEVTFGNLGIFYENIATEDPEFRRAVFLRQEPKLFPTRVGCSLIEMYPVEVQTGSRTRKISLARALYDDIPFEPRSSESIMTTKWTKDVFPGIITLGFAFSGKLPFSYSDPVKFKDWYESVFNSMAYLRQNPIPGYDTGSHYFSVLNDPNFYAFIMAGSVGVKLDHKRLILNFNEKEVPAMGYDVALDQILLGTNLLKVDKSVNAKEFARQIKAILNGESWVKNWWTRQTSYRNTQ